MILFQGQTKLRYLQKCVRRKWPTQEQKEWWYTKFGAVRRKKLTFLFEQQNGLCFYCDTRCFMCLDEDRTKPTVPKGMFKRQRATLEHLIPQSEGGFDDIPNLKMACNYCNQLRGIRDWRSFKETAKQRLIQGTFYSHGRTDVTDRKQQIQKNINDHLKKYRVQVYCFKLAIAFIIVPELKTEIECEIKRIASFRPPHNNDWLI